MAEKKKGQTNSTRWDTSGRMMSKRKGERQGALNRTGKWGLTEKPKEMEQSDLEGHDQDVSG